MIEPSAMNVLLEKVEKAPDNGIIVIAGTCHGGDVMAIRDKFPGKYIVVIDSFKGLDIPHPEHDPHDTDMVGAHNNNGVDQYKANFEELGVDLPDEIFEMWISPENLKEIGERDISLLFMDLDHYLPVKACLEYFYPMVSRGGIIISHDFAWYRTTGVVKACEEFSQVKEWTREKGFGFYIKGVD
jgi:hypothetical protein